VARIILRDAQGREIATEQPFYASPALLRAGLYDYSIEAGVARRDHGTDSFDYDDRLAGSASLRYGTQDRLTTEGHIEAMAGHVSAGAGAVFSTGSLGVISAAVEGSHFDGAAGGQLNAGWQFSRGNFSFTASGKLSLGPFADLALATAESSADSFTLKSLEQISLGYGFPDWRSSIGASVIHSVYRDGPDSIILSALFSQQLPFNASFHASGFVDLEDRGSLGVQAGVHIPLGGTYSSAAYLQLDEDGAQATSSVMKSLESHPGGYGWRLQYGDGAERRLAGAGNYYTSRNLVSGTAQNQNGTTSATLGVEGAFALADGDLFLSRRITNGLSIVDAGTDEVAVYSQNRLVGKTGASGKLLVPDLSPYQSNTLRIEADDLPIEAEIPRTEAQTVVARNSGSVVRFGVKRQTASAIVVFLQEDGSFAPAGSMARLVGADEQFIVGYDGQAYLTGLSARNHVVLELPDGSCAARFAYAPAASGQTFVDGVICR
jgi:outer membrane usher protein